MTIAKLGSEGPQASLISLDPRPRLHARTMKGRTRLETNPRSAAGGIIALSVIDKAGRIFVNPLKEASTEVVTRFPVPFQFD